jgi:TorA maturation chaperone TorD
MNAHRTTIEKLHYQTDLLTCLSQIYWMTPKRDALEALSTSIRAGSELSVGVELVSLIEGLGEEQYRDIAVDYTDLFCGFDARSPYPYESICLSETRLLMQTSAIAVKKVYAESGYTPEDGAGNEPPDHLTFELRYLVFLLEKAIDALEHEDTQAAEGFMEKKDEFLEEHLRVWIPSFCKEVRERAATDFFRKLSLLTEHIVCDVV